MYIYIYRERERYDFKGCCFFEMDVAQFQISEIAFWDFLNVLHCMRPAADMTVDNALLAGWKKARSMVNKMTSAAVDLTAKQWAEVLEKKMGLLLGFDETFHVEMGLLKSLAVGSEGVVRIKAEILDKLPASGTGMTLHQGLAAVEELKAAPIYKFLSDAAKSYLDTMVKALKDMVAGESPSELLCDAEDIKRFG